jgi:MoxR-like ATPase
VSAAPPPLDELTATGTAVIDEIERAVVGKRDVLELLLLGVLAGGHVLLEDVPGVAKTLIARSLAAVLQLRFARVQFTPDLLPGDITGATVFHQPTGRFEFRPGPVFTNVLLADEINRAPAKTQAALLEAMAEQQVTTDDGTRPLDPPFLVIATQNPVEYEGTYPLPEAQLDRFLLRLHVGYPAREDEWRMLRERAERRREAVDLRPVLDGDRLLALQRVVERVHVDDDVGRYMVDLVAATRASPSVDLGASPRGSLALLRLGRARAALHGRAFVTPDDVKAVAVPALAHRILVSAERWLARLSGEDVVRECLGAVPTPEPLPEP